MKLKSNQILGIVLIIFGVGMFMGTFGCNQPNMQDGAKPVVKESASNSGLADLRGTYIEFDGHEYVHFSGCWGDSSRYFGIAHSPKCSCLVQEGK